jgi:hypothetical protein
VLGRLKVFLPMMDEANQKLFSSIEEKGRQAFDIEVVDEDDNKPHIEMVSCYVPQGVLESLLFDTVASRLVFCLPVVFF